MPDKLLSTDPRAGVLLSADPSAGVVAPPAGSPTIGAANDGSKGVTFGDQARQLGWFEDRGMAGGEFHGPEGAGSDRTRTDNAILGMPPELAVTMPLSIGRAAIGGGPGVGAKMTAGAKSAWNTVGAPTVKYEIVKTALESVGVPAGIAIPIAMTASGLAGAKGGKHSHRAPKAAPAPAAAAAPKPAVHPMAEGMAAAPAPAPTAPPAALVAAPAPAAAASAHPRYQAGDPSAPSWLMQGAKAGEARVLSPAAIRMELGLVSKRVGANLSDVEFGEASKLVTAGRTPAQAVADVSMARGASRAASVPVAPAPPAGPASPGSPAASPVTVGGKKLQLTPEEMKEVLKLLASGKSQKEALKAIEQQRKLTSTLGTPSVESVERAVTTRKTTGRWPEGRPGT